MKIFVSWSGGKETSLSCYKVMQNQDAKVVYLLNMVSEDGKYSHSHGVSSNLLRVQAELIGIPIIQRKTTWNTYEEEFKKAVSYLKKENIEAGAFGDIDLQEHKDWIERVCKELGIEPILPLWQRKREEILKEFIGSGFEAVVVSTRADILGPEWLGRKINNGFIEDLKKLGGVDLCGENGEYHTFVVSGPIFREKTKILKAKKVKKDKNWFLEVLDYEITEKT